MNERLTIFFNIKDNEEFEEVSPRILQLVEEANLLNSRIYVYNTRQKLSLNYKMEPFYMEPAVFYEKMHLKTNNNVSKYFKYEKTLPDCELSKIANGFFDEIYLAGDAEELALNIQSLATKLQQNNSNTNIIVSKDSLIPVKNFSVKDATEIIKEINQILYNINFCK